MSILLLKNVLIEEEIDIELYVIAVATVVKFDRVGQVQFDRKEY